MVTLKVKLYHVIGICKTSLPKSYQIITNIDYIIIRLKICYLIESRTINYFILPSSSK